VLDLLGLRLALADDELEAPHARLFAEKVALFAPEDLAESWPVLRKWIDAHPVDAVLAQTEAGLPSARSPCVTRECEGSGSRPRICARTSTARAWRRGARPAARVCWFHRGRGTSLRRRAAAVLRSAWATASARQRLVVVRDPSAPDDAVSRMQDGLRARSDVARLADFARDGPDLGCDPRKHFLVESFAAGDPVEWTACSSDRSRSRSASSTRCTRARPTSSSRAISCRARPAHEIETIEQTVRARRCTRLASLDTGYSVELRAGPEPRIIEVNGRLGIDEGYAGALRGGDRPPSAVARVRARAPRQAAGLAPTGAHAALAYQCCYRDARVEALPSSTAVRALEHAGLQVGINATRGEILRAPGDAADVRPHLAHAIACDERSSFVAHTRARAAVDGLVFELAPVLRPSVAGA
jgi:hypothetical protein